MFSLFSLFFNSFCYFILAVNLVLRFWTDCNDQSLVSEVMNGGSLHEIFFTSSNCYRFWTMKAFLSFSFYFSFRLFNYFSFFLVLVHCSFRIYWSHRNSQCGPWLYGFLPFKSLIFISLFLGLWGISLQLPSLFFFIMVLKSYLKDDLGFSFHCRELFLLFLFLLLSLFSLFIFIFIFWFFFLLFSFIFFFIFSFISYFLSLVLFHYYLLIQFYVH
jgi:hypothetical protein